MKIIIFRSIFAVMVGLCVTAGIVAQTRSTVAERYIISAKAGGVNHIEGSVSVVRENGLSGLLLKGDQIETGDMVSTSANGRAEVLLNPGSYIRIGGNSSFEFGTTDLEDLQIRLEKGSAIFEVFAADEFRVSVFTPKGMVALVETGVYRIDIANDGSGLVAVTKGKAEVGAANSTEVKQGRTGTIGTNTVTIAKFDTGKRDELAEWSRSRAKELTKMTASLKNRDVGNSLLSAFRGGMWGLYDSFGLWIYSPMYGRYCFLPFGAGWYSPYGYGYRNGINWYNLPYVPYTTPYSPTPGTVGGSPNPNNTQKTRRVPSPIVSSPPFMKVQKQREPQTRVFDTPTFSSDNFSRSRGGSTPTNSAPPMRQSEPSAPSAPPSQRQKPIQ